MHQPHPRAFSRFVGSLALAISVSVSATPLAFAAPGDVNSINNGQNIAGGTYYNTPGDKTTFVNTSGSGLYLHNGVTVTGLESDAAGNATGNGGWLHFYAPGQVVRLDGTVNVSALMGKGGYAGNGGRVTVDSALLYQNGAIFANGRNGGAVQMNVGAAVFGPSARIDARGVANGAQGGFGGSVSIQSPGVVDIQRGAIVDVSGRVIGTYDTTIINIDGGLINVEGVLRADGVQLEPGSRSAAPAGGTIRLVASGAAKPACLVDCALEKAGALMSREERADLLTRQEALIRDHDGDIKISETGLLSADGAAGQNGGTVILSAMRHVATDGVIRANGGQGLNNAVSEEIASEDMLFRSDSTIIRPKSAGQGGQGGTISVSAGASVYNGGLIQANGGAGAGSPASDSVSVINHEGPATANANASGEFSSAATGGNGGAIAFSYRNELVNSGLIQANGGAGGQGGSAFANAESYASAAQATANAIGGAGGHGGHGGLIVLSGYVNPTGGGHVEANGGQGGQGGDATALATAHGERSASATANAIAGEGGQGGEAGLIVAPNPATFDADQSHSSRDGLQGAGGHALAKADAVSGGVTEATANANSGFMGQADAIAYAAQAGVVMGGDPNAVAKALAGDFGVANAISDALGVDEAHATSDASAGAFGQATAKSTAYSQEQIATANAGALTAQGGLSIANAYALSFYVAKADAKANTGDAGVSLADALAKSLHDNADASSAANSGEDGYSRANAKSIAFLDASVDAAANAGDGGYAESNADATAGDDVKKAKSAANSGENGVSIATGKAQAGNAAGNDVTSFSVKANSGDGGQSLAKGAACAGGDISADVKANAGQDGKAFATLKAFAGHDIKNADAAANVGQGGFASASGVVSAGNEVKDLSVLALGGQDATALAHADATAVNDVKKVTASAITAEGGFAKADAWGASGGDATDDVDVKARALSGAHGVALAEAHGVGGDDIVADANATSGAFGFTEAKAVAEATNPQTADAIASANATTGASGQARAIAYSASADDGKADARATHGAGGGGEALISLNIVDDWSATAWPGGAPSYSGSGSHGAHFGLTRLHGAPVGLTPATPAASEPVTHIAVWTPGSPSASVGENAIAQLQRNELVIHGPNAILLSVDEGDFGNLSLLSERLKDAKVRTVLNPTTAPGWSDFYAGGGFWNEGFNYWPGAFRNLVIGSATVETLILDQPQGRSWGRDESVYFWPAAFDGLNTLTVLNSGSLLNPAENGGWTVGHTGDRPCLPSTGGHISLLSVYGAIHNDNDLRSLGDALGGSIVLAAGGRCRGNGGVVNTGVIATNPGWSLPDHGGAIILKSRAGIFNFGDIDANGDSAGGVITLQTCRDILNAGTIKAMAAGTVDGPGQGGIILSQAGRYNFNAGQMLVDGDVSGARGDGGYLLQYGGLLAVNCGLLSANGNDAGKGGTVVLASRGVAANLGLIRALGGLGDGLVVLAGDEAVVQGEESTILAGETRIYEGEGAVESVLCNPLPGPNDGNGRNPVARPAYDLLGLFQEERFGPLERIPTLFRLVLRIPDPAAMLSSVYLPVTEEILALALEDFHRQLSMGQTIEEARRHAILYLREAGVTRQVAQALTESASKGTIKADKAIVKALDVMANTPDAPKGESPLVQ